MGGSVVQGAEKVGTARCFQQEILNLYQYSRDLFESIHLTYYLAHNRTDIMQQSVLYVCGLCRVPVFFVWATWEVVVVLLAVEIAFLPFPILPRGGICLQYVSFASY